MTLKEAMFKQSITELHWAAQVVASVGPTYLPAQKSNHHLALNWDARGWIVSPEIKPNRSFEVALDIAHLQLHFLGHADAPNRQPSSTFTLRGHTLAAAYTWLEETLAAYLQRDFEHVKRLSELPWELPAHPLNRGALFSYQESSFKHCEEAFVAAHAQLSALHQRYHANAHPLHVWPQELTLSTLLHEIDREIEVGFALSTSKVPEPHYFLKSTQVPVTKPNLAHGHWQGSLIVLPLQTLASLAPAQQAQQVATFLAENTHYLWTLPHQSDDVFM